MHIIKADAELFGQSVSNRFFNCHRVAEAILADHSRVNHFGCLANELRGHSDGGAKPARITLESWLLWIGLQPDEINGCLHVEEQRWVQADVRVFLAEDRVVGGPCPGKYLLVNADNELVRHVFFANTPFDTVFVDEPVHNLQRNIRLVLNEQFDVKVSDEFFFAIKGRLHGFQGTCSRRK